MDEFNCNFCEKIFNDPVLLPCGDAVCKKCLKSHLKLNHVTKHFSSNNIYSDEENKYFCPLCNAKFRLAEGVDSLPKYGVISKMINESHPNEGCDYNYCCGSFHFQNGTKNSHRITSVQENSFDCYHFCRYHSDEKKKLLCLECGVCICFLCKEIGYHKNHATALVTNRCDTDVNKLFKNKQSCQYKSAEVTMNLQKMEQFVFDIKQSGLITEANVNRECDQLIDLIEVNRARMLEELDKKYCSVLKMLNTNLDMLLLDYNNLLKIQDIISYAISCKDPVAILESMPAIEKRYKELTSKTNENISLCKKLRKVIPFKGMVVDSQSARKTLKRFYWLAPPRAPHFQIDACIMENNKIQLVWKQSVDRINKFYLEKSNDGIEFELIYEGEKHFFECVNLKYNEQVYFSVYASNQAGIGSRSKMISFKTCEGFTFKIDETKTHPTVKVSNDLLSFQVKHNVGWEIKNTDGREIFTNAIVKSGKHHWQVKVDHIVMKKDAQGSISIGVLSDTNTEKQNSLVYMLQFNRSNLNKKDSNKLMSCMESPSDLIDQNLSFVLDLDNMYFDVFMNGQVQTPNLLSKHSFENIDKCGYSVFVNVNNLCVKMSFINSLKMPLSPPDSPIFFEEECHSINLGISYKWHSNGIDCYYLEIVKDKNSFGEVQPVYRGTSGYFLYETENYNETIYARLFALNIVGMSPPSKIVTVSTSNGINFSFEQIKEKSLKYLDENCSVEYSSNIPVLLFGNYIVNRGVHFWRFQLEQVKGKCSKIGLGLAKYGILKQDYGLADSCVIMVSKVPQNDAFCQTIYIADKYLNQSEIAFLVDMNSRKLYCYLNGILLIQKKDLQFNVNQICSFVDVPTNVVPCLLLVGNVKVSLKCNLSVPTVPAPSFFKYFVCENISCHYEWAPSSRAGSYTNYFILKVAVLSATTEQLPKDEKFKIVYKGSRTNYVLHPVKYNSKIIATVISVNYAGESMESERVILYSAKAFRFKFDSNEKSEVLELENDGYTVLLKVRVHSFALGSELIKVGFHSWSIRIDEFFDNNRMSVVGIGISKLQLNDPILGEDDFTYAVQIIEHPKVILSHTKHRHQLRMDKSKACGLVVTVDVNLDEHWSNIYLNGTRVINDVDDHEKPTFDCVYGEFYPAVSLYGSRVKLSIVNN
ncbi:uncharacterized protein LOC136071910 isoform X1 [Hydra vulgaris]|uniref:Uncharacterized protein LOC136071910 isoform X1 n=2 Tax=Hydra vulgaris TaxID=6087 RepID=A0ABM4BX22_HYDVU